MGVKETVTNAYSNWMGEGTPQGDVVVSSRIRIARNLVGIPFPNLMDDDDWQGVFHGVQQAIKSTNLQAQFGRLELVHMSELSPVERSILMDKHLISPDLLKDYQKKAVVLSDDEQVSIMVNEEDHLRIQCLLPGLQMEKAWRLADLIDDELERTLDFAFSEQLGYLTTCPTNVGTGLRASVMVHLPGLTMLNQISTIIEAVAKLGLTVRGMYGEGTQASGNLYQISNQVTLGLTEEEIINNLTSIIEQVIEQERSARRALYRDNKYQLEDRIFRAYGTLKHARLLNSEEAMKLISDVRLGVDLDIIHDIKPSILNQLLVITRPAYLIKHAKRELNAHQRDILRAELVRSKLS